MLWLRWPTATKTLDRQMTMNVGLSSSEKSNIWRSMAHATALSDELTIDPSTVFVPGILVRLYTVAITPVIHDNLFYDTTWRLQCESKKIPPASISDIFSQTVRNFSSIFLQTYCTFLSTLDRKFLFRYLQFWRSYAVLSANLVHVICSKWQSAETRAFKRLLWWLDVDSFVDR